MRRNMEHRESEVPDKKKFYKYSSNEYLNALTNVEIGKDQKNTRAGRSLRDVNDIASKKEHMGDGVKETLLRNVAEQLIHEEYGKYFKGKDPTNLNELVKFKGIEWKTRKLTSSNKKIILDDEGGIKKEEWGPNTYGLTYHESKNALVDRAKLNLQTNIHEGLHSHSAWKLKEQLNEGVTQYFTEQILENHEIPQHHNSYKFEKDITRKIAEICGLRVLEEAYFNGNVSELEQAIDDKLGKGTFDRINFYLELNTKIIRKKETYKLFENESNKKK